MKILLTDETRRAKYISRILKLLEHFYFYILHFLYVRRMWLRRDVLFCKYSLVKLFEHIPSLGIYNFSKTH